MPTSLARQPDDAQAGEPFAFFAPDEAGYRPLWLAQSSWSAEQAHGVAVSGLLAHAAEQAVVVHGRREELRPARWSVDLFRPVRMTPCTTRAEVLRSGGRLLLVDVVLEQNGEPVARASATFLKPTENAPGRTWAPDLERPAAPPVEVAPPTTDPHVPFFRSGGEWSQRFKEHQNAGQHSQWTTVPTVVDGQPRTPFVAAAAAADGANLVANWGADGVQHINADLTLTLVREPEGVSLGLTVVDRLEVDGIVVATVAVYDRRGPLGSVVVTGLSNLRRAIDFAGVRVGEEGRTEPGA